MSIDYLLQMRYDAALIRAWHQHWRMNRLCAEFARLDTRDSLLRFPQFWGWNMPVRAFVDQHLSKLSDILLSGKHSDPDVVLWLESSGLNWTPRKIYRDKSLSSSIQNEKRRKVRTRRVDVHKGHRRSDWGVCKQ